MAEETPPRSAGRAYWDALFAKRRPYGTTDGPPPPGVAMSPAEVDELERRLGIVLAAPPYQVRVRLTEGSPENVGQFHAGAVEMAVGLIATIRELQARVAELEAGG